MREITCEELKSKMGTVRLIDVRRDDEFTGELGHIPGAKLITLGPDLIAFLERESHDAEMIFVCRSGARSGQTTLLSEEMGFRATANLIGGMLRWNELGYEIEKGEHK